MRKLGTPEVVIATTSARVYDETMGIHRKVVAGQPVPPELVDAYIQDGGETTPPGEQRPAGAVIAHETLVVRDDNLGINRKLIAGQPVPPDLLEAYRSATAGTAPEDDEPDAGGANYDAMSKAELERLVSERGIEDQVKGTGASGNVKVADLVRALQAHDSTEEA